MGKIIDIEALSRFKTKFIEKVLDTEGRGIHFGTETDYPLSAAHTEYPIGVTLIYTASNTSYPYGTGTVVTIRSANARCVQYNVGNTPNNYKMRTADSSGWSDWKSLKDVPGVTDLQKAIGIVVDGNKAASAAAIGKFVVLKNSTISGRADGLYTAAKAISANTAIDNTYLTAISNGGLNNLSVLSVNCGTISSLPATVTNANIANDMLVLRTVFGNPSAQLDDWSVSTSNGSLTISGTISGSTALTLYLMKAR